MDAEPLDTLAQIDAEIAREHRLEVAAYAAGHDGEALFYVLDIERLVNLRRIVAGGPVVAEELRRARLRNLSERHAQAMYRGDRDTAALLADQIQRLELEGGR
jgi:hypothetical protein